MCKPNFIHVCFVIDESGSMAGSESDVIGGFNKTIDEQRAVEGGECVVSYFKFSDNVTEVFVGKKLEDIKPLTKGTTSWYSFSTASYNSTINDDGSISISTEIEEHVKDTTYEYSPGGCTAMNDGIGTAIDKIGKWLADMPEDERPAKNLIVIMTDGEENVSKEYSLAKVQEMIKHQTEKYDWTFVYMGMDITSKSAADNLGIHTRSFSSKVSDDTYANYSNISESIKCYRMSDASVANSVMCCSLDNSLKAMTKSYEDRLNIEIE